MSTQSFISKAIMVATTLLGLSGKVDAGSTKISTTITMPTETSAPTLTAMSKTTTITKTAGGATGTITCTMADDFPGVIQQVTPTPFAAAAPTTTLYITAPTSSGLKPQIATCRYQQPTYASGFATVVTTPEAMDTHSTWDPMPINEPCHGGDDTDSDDEEDM